MRPATLLAAVLLFFPGLARGEDNQSKPPRYDVVCFCEASEGTPGQILRLDNNAQILGACTSPKTLEQLQVEGIAVSASQIRLLRDWRLLAEREGRLQTTFKILSREEANGLRQHTRTVAAKIADNVRPDVAGLTKLLEAGHPGSSFVVLFAYVLDGLVWDRFMEKGQIRKPAVSAEHPFWDGTFWGTWQQRPFFCGTNSYDHDGFTLKIAWSRSARKGLGPLWSDAAGVEALVADYAEHGAVADPALRSKFQAVNLVDPGGRLLVPIIDERGSGPLLGSAAALSRKVAAAAELLSVDELQKRFGFASREETLIIAYHDLMWDILAMLEGEGAIRRPLLFADPEKATPADAGQLVFGVWSKGSRKP
jgi:hypothetical protein